MTLNHKITAVIPARYGSTRFPGKPLARIKNKPMIQWVYEKAAYARIIDKVIVATDDERISDAVKAFGGNAVLTSADHQTGSDRIAEAVQDLDCDIVINLQGDEPLIPSEVIDNLANVMIEEKCPMATVAVPFSCTTSEPDDPNAVKVVTGSDDYALYFSRSLIPCQRDPGEDCYQPLLHWGIYGYRKEFLQKFVTWKQGKLERTEKLEQLRALENGASIKVIKVQTPTRGVDTPEDLQTIENLIN